MTRLVVVVGLAVGVALVLVLVFLGRVEPEREVSARVVRPVRNLAEPTTTVVSPPSTVKEPAVRLKVAAEAPVRPVGEIADAVRRGFARFGPVVAEEAVRVAGCECCGDPTGRRLDPAAVNGAHAGLFQVSRTYHEARAARLGFTWAQMFDVEPNVAVAADLYASQGWRPWTCRWAA